jgi:phosphomannomutase
MQDTSKESSMEHRAGADANESHGVFGPGVDGQLAHLLGQAVGTRLAASRLVVGGDGQPGSAALQEALVSGALRTGCTVYDFGTVPTPALYFAKDRFWADGAAMVTGTQGKSRFALSLGKLPATELELAELEQAVEQRGPFAAGKGQLLNSDIIEPYRSFLVAHFVPVQPLPVMVGGLSSGPVGAAQETLRVLGYDVLECPSALGSDPASDSVGESLVQAMCRGVPQQRARLGMLCSDNGSQALLVDETGTVLTPQQALVLLARALLRYEPGSGVIYDERLGSAVGDQIRRVGGEPVAVRSGSPGVRRLLLESGAILGADAGGRYCFRTMGAEDALYATLVMLRIASRLGGALRPSLARLDL